MTIFSAVSQETNLGGVLTTSLSTSGSSFSARMYDTKTGLSRTPQSTTLDFIISHGTTKAERIRCSSHSTASGITTFTIASSGRALPMYGTGAGASSGNAHYIGATIGCVTNHEATEELNKVVDGTNGTGANNFRVGAETAADVSFYAQNDQTTKPRVYFDESAKTWKISRGDDNGAAGDFAIHQLPQLTTAERDALPEIVNGYAIYNTTLGTAQYYKAGAWVSFDVGTPPGNAADHTAGLLDVASTTEMQAGTATDATSGALNAVVVGNTTETSAGAGDYGKVPRLGSGGRLDDTVHNQTLVGGLTTNADTLHTHRSFARDYTAGENMTVTGDWIPVFVSNGTGGLTSGRVYQSEYNHYAEERNKFHGFIKASATTGNTITVYWGEVDGWTTSWTPGRKVWINTSSPGMPTQTEPTVANRICLGTAMYNDRINTFWGEGMQSYLVRSSLTMPAAGATADTTIAVGFKVTHLAISGHIIIYDGAGANGQRKIINRAVWTGDATFVGGSVIIDNGAATYGGYQEGATASTLFSVVASGGVNRSSLTFNLQSISDSGITFRVTNTVTAGAGSTNGDEIILEIEVWGYRV